jgi:hypothetical protein
MLFKKRLKTAKNEQKMGKFSKKSENGFSKNEIFFRL